jgi:hypothetical protein
MKVRLLSVFVFSLLLTWGCKDLKDQQLGAYVGDSQTKIVYKNVGKNTKVVPKDRQVFFRSQDDAMKEGYTLENVAGGESGGSEE